MLSSCPGVDALNLHDGDIEWSCSKAEYDESAGDWSATQDCTHHFFMY